MSTTKADDLARKIEEAILIGEFEPGAVLRQEQLSEYFGVSRTPVREALRQLAALGLVTFVANRGVRVPRLAREELLQGMLVRANLEGLAAEMAAPSMTGGELDEVRSAADQFAALTSTMSSKSADRRAVAVEWNAANDAFHDAIVTAARAPILAHLIRNVRRVFPVEVLEGSPEHVENLLHKNLVQHEAVLAALTAKNGAAARSLIEQHVISSGEVLVSLLEEMRRGRRQSTEQADVNGRVVSIRESSY